MQNSRLSDYSSVIDSSLTDGTLQDPEVAAQLLGNSTNTNNSTGHNINTSGKITKPNKDTRRNLHIKSEQRRREKIYDGFAQLRAVVPLVRQGHDSKATLLTKAAQYIQALQFEVNSLKSQLSTMESFYRENAASFAAAAAAAAAAESGTPSENDKGKKQMDKNDSGNINGDSGDGSEKMEHKNGANDAMKDENKDFAESFPMSPVNMMGMPIPIGMVLPPQGIQQPMPPHQMYPFMPPIIGTAADVGEHPSANLMHPTVPYYFAEGFMNKRKREKSGQDDEEAEKNGKSEETKKSVEKEGQEKVQMQNSSQISSEQPMRGEGAEDEKRLEENGDAVFDMVVTDNDDPELKSDLKVEHKEHDK